MAFRFTGRARAALGGSGDDIESSDPERSFPMPTGGPKPLVRDDVHININKQPSGINILPSEVLRQIIIYLIHDPSRPIAFLKSALLPLSSTSKALRAVSTEFLYGSMDLFEASFGLRHRVLPSNTILELFFHLIDPPVTSFIRSGVRRLLIRDRDRKALLAPEGQQHLSGILNRVENLRSIHFDGHFYRLPPIHQELDILPASRLNETLVNLTFLNCDPRSPIFPCFLASGRWTNLTRIQYRAEASLQYTSPFATLQTLTDPVFPYLSTFVLAHTYTNLADFTTVLVFLALHRHSLQRLSISSFGNYEHYNFNAFQSNKVVYYDAGARNAAVAREECMSALWAALPALHRLHLLDIDIGMTRAAYAPTQVVRIPSLRGVNLHNESAWQHLQSYPHNEAGLHPVTSFFNHVPSPSIAYTHGLPADRIVAPKPVDGNQRITDAGHWFGNASQLRHARNFSLLDASEGNKVWVLLEGGGEREVLPATDAQKKDLEGFVGGWFVGEDADLNWRFV